MARESWLACQVINGGQCKATRGKGGKSRVALMVTPEKVPMMLSCQLQGLRPTGWGPRLYVSALVGVCIFRGNGFRVPGFARKRRARPSGCTVLRMRCSACMWLKIKMLRRLKATQVSVIESPACMYEVCDRSSRDPSRFGDKPMDQSTLVLCP